MVFNCILGILLVPLARPTKSFRNWFVFAMTFPNITALPLAFNSAVCAASSIPKPDGSGEFYTTSECTEKGEVYLFIYTIIPTIMFFIAAALVKGEETEVPVSTTAEAGAPFKKVQDIRLENNQYVKDGHGPAIEDVTPTIHTVHQQQTSEPMSDRAHAMHNISETNNGTAQEENVVVSASDTPTGDQVSRTPISSAEFSNLPNTETTVHIEEGGTTIDKKMSSKKSTWKRKGRLLLGAMIDPVVSSQMIAIVIALITPLQTFVFSNNSFATPFVSTLRMIAPGLVSVVTIALSTLIGVKLTKTRWSEILGGDEETMGISRRTLAFFVFGRILIIPGACYAVLYLTFDLFPKDQLMMLILFYETFVPSANLTALLAPPEQGQIISLGMVNQYLVGIFTMTMYCFLALTIIDNADS